MDYNWRLVDNRLSSFDVGTNNLSAKDLFIFIY